MKKYLKSGIIVLVILVLCFMYAQIDKMHPVFNTDVDPSAYSSTEVGTTEVFEQTFVSKEKAVDGIAVKFVTTGADLDKVNLIYSIEDESGNVLGSGKLSGDKFRNQKYNKLNVERIDDAKGKKLVFKCQMENNDKDNGISIYQEGENIVMKYYMSRFDLESFIVACALCLYVIVFMKILFKMFRE